MPNDTTPALTCPKCNSKGHSPAFVHTGDGSRFEPELPCDFCGGSGRITAQQADWHARGKRLRNARVHRSESLREMARRLGIKPELASAMESGRADPAPLEAAMSSDATPPRHGRAPDDEAERNAALEAVVYGRDQAPTVAEAAAALGWAPLAVAEAVGSHYWMFLHGDLNSPETARILSDGE